MKRRSILFFEPFGQGGISHYTYMLAESIAKSGADVTLLTKAPYELENLPRSFQLDRSLGGSAIKAWFRKKAAPSRSGEPRSPDRAARPAGGGGKNRPARSSRLRVHLHWLELTFRLAFSRPDVLHVQWLHHPEIEYAYLRFLRFLGIRIVYTAHNLLPHSDQSAGTADAFRKVYRAVNRIVVHSDSNATELARMFPVDPAKIAVIPHGHYGFFRSLSGRNMAEARKKLDLDPDRKIILNFGRIRPYKGVRYLLEAFGSVAREFDESLLLLVGTVPPGETEDDEYYHSLIDQYGIADRMRFDNRYIPLESVGDYFCACDLVVLPYVKTYQSGILMLAIAYGKPAIVTETGGLPDVVEDGKNGFVVPPRDSAALANAAARILGDDALRERMGLATRELAETRFGWESIASKTLEMYGMDNIGTDRNSSEDQG